MTINIIGSIACLGMAVPSLLKRFEFFGVPSNRRRYWLVFEDGDADLCNKDPGFETDLYVSTHVRTLTEIWPGHLTLQSGLRDERVRLEGARQDVRWFSDWFSLSRFAEAGAEPPGHVAEAS